MFFAGAILKKETATRAGGLARKVEPEGRRRGTAFVPLPSPLRGFRGLVAGGPFEKFAKLKRCNRGFGNIGTESPLKPSSAPIAALYELFLVSNRIAQWPQFAPRYGFGHRE